MRQVALFSAMLLAASAAGAVSVVNGSFELGKGAGKSTLLLADDITSLPGWKVGATNIDIVGTAWRASDGLRSVDLSGTAPGSVLQTLHGLTPGTAYQLTFDMSGSYAGARTAPNRMQVFATGNAGQTYSFNKNNTVDNMMYTAETYTFTPTQSVSVIRFNSLDAGNYGPVLDNVGIKIAPAGTGPGVGPISGQGMVPEPATWAMMIAGFGFSGLAMRRRQNGLTTVAA